jgi:hypothetical protein
MPTQRLRHFITIALLCSLLISACAADDARVVEGPVGSDAAVPTAASPALPTPTFVPVDDGAARRTPLIGSAQGTTLRLEDTDWTGGYRLAGASSYGGRSATWIYGTSTDFSEMQASFEVEGAPFGTAELSVEGMDSEGPAKTPIEIIVNGEPIYNGPNPLPDDDFVLQTGTWQTESWSFEGDLLRSGSNTITIRNLAPGQFSRPPFFMLDYAEVIYESQ